MNPLSKKGNHNITKSIHSFNSRIVDIYSQKEEIAALMNDIHAYKTQNSAIVDLKAEIHNLTR